MSDGEGNSQQAQAFAQMWTDFASKMAGAGFSFGADATPPEAARHVRDAMFQAMAQYCEQYMRSPQFLESMKQSMDTAIEFRKQLNDFLTRAHHEMQGVARSDVDALMVAIRRAETRVLARIEDITARLEELGDRLDKLDGAAQTSSSSAASRPPTAKRPRPGAKKRSPAAEPKPRTKKKT